MPDREKVINKVTAIVADMQEEVDEWKDYSDSELRGGLTCDCDWWYKTLQTLKDALALLKAQELRHRLEVHNIGNVDVPEGVTWEQFQAVISGVVKALEHTDRGESWPYDEDRR